MNIITFATIYKTIIQTLKKCIQDTPAVNYIMTFLFFKSIISPFGAKQS